MIEVTAPAKKALVVQISPTYLSTVRARRMHIPTIKIAQ